MSKMIVTNPNIVFVSSSKGPNVQVRRDEPPARRETEMALARQLRQFREKIDQLVCSATWAEDCLFRGAQYAPDFRCGCPVCRKFFPNRRYPRATRESNYSIDCQIETDEDPEFAEEFARLRNERPRYGSVFAGRPKMSMYGN
jgi:hypothetical protein